MENEQMVDELIRLLKSKEVLFEVGLTSNELASIEEKFTFIFPQDLKLFLHRGLPVSTCFVNWRKALHSDEYYDQVNSSMEAPLEGLLFDVEYNNFWFKEWGAKPETFDLQANSIRERFVSYSVLIPIFSHRYISSEPTGSDNPVFSIVQTDIIHYGNNLVDYFQKEFYFELPEYVQIPENPKLIRFWSDLVELNSNCMHSIG